MVKKQRTNKRYLFWCYTNNGDEAWFEIATNKKTARKNYAFGFGMEISDVKSKLVCEISRKPSIRSGETITIEYLKDIGFEIVTESYPPIVRFNGNVYKSGSFFEKMMEERNIPKFPCVYFFKILETDRYKIGSTKDLINRKLRLESQQAHHIHLKTFIETDEFIEIESYIKRFLERYRVKGDEWFRFDKFITANIEILFEIIKVEIKMEPSFHFRSELFEVMTDEIKEIMSEHIFGAEPSNELIQKLNVVFRLNSKRKSNLDFKIKREEILQRWIDSKNRLDNLELQYIKNFCPYKLGDIITDKYKNTFKINGRFVYFNEKDKKANFYYSGPQLLKNGNEGKRFKGFILAEDK
jgi:hypothetical protein